MFRRSLVCFVLAVLLGGPSHQVFAQGDSAQFRALMAKAVRTAAQRALESVVSIEVIGVVQSANANQQSEVSQDAPTCGVVVDGDGFILASDIVVKSPSASILAVLQDQTRLAAEVIARDHHRGLVLLKVKPHPSLKPIEFPESMDTPIGSTVVAVGRYGDQQSPIVSSGILSATGRIEGTMLQCDARVSPAFYGGLLVDLHGNSLGIIVPAVAEGGAPDDTSWYDSGIAFAVPTSVVSAKLPKLKTGDDVKRGLIGIVPKAKDPYAEDTELAAVRVRSPAEKVGIKPGDVVEQVGGKPVRMFQEIRQALGPYDAGETIELVIRRKNEKKTFSIELADTIPPLQPQRLGVWVEETSAETPGENADDDNNTPSANLLVRGVVPGTAADGALQAGDLIESIDGSDVSDIGALRRIMISAAADTAMTVIVSRGGEQKSVSLNPTSIAGPALKETVDDWKDKKPTETWTVAELRLPDVSNAAAYVTPDPKNVSDQDALAMLVLVIPPKMRNPKEILDSWRDVAGRYGVVVCAVCSEDEKGWSPNEVDVVTRMTKTAMQRVPVDASAVAIAATGAIEGVDPSSADSMAIAVALSSQKLFSGISISAQAKPPAVRLRENEPDHSIQILMPIESLDDGPVWLAPLTRFGYPILLGGKNELSSILRWTRLLQTI